MTKEEFINRYMQDLASKRREKDYMLNDYFGERKRKKRPWGYSGVIGSA